MRIVKKCFDAQDKNIKRQTKIHDREKSKSMEIKGREVLR